LAGKPSSTQFVGTKTTIGEADELGRRFRVEGVPFFIINGKIARN
jgi:hypothetical protein